MTDREKIDAMGLQIEQLDSRLQENHDHLMRLIRMNNAAVETLFRIASAPTLDARAEAKRALKVIANLIDDTPSAKAP